MTNQININQSTVKVQVNPSNVSKNQSLWGSILGELEEQEDVVAALSDKISISPGLSSIEVVTVLPDTPQPDVLYIIRS